MYPNPLTASAAENLPSVTSLYPRPSFSSNPSSVYYAGTFGAYTAPFAASASCTRSK